MTTATDPIQPYGMKGMANYLDKFNDLPIESAGGITLELLAKQVKFLHTILVDSLKTMISNYNRGIDLHDSIQTMSDQLQGYDGSYAQMQIKLFKVF